MQPDRQFRGRVAGVAPIFVLIITALVSSVFSVAALSTNLGGIIPRQRLNSALTVGEDGVIQSNNSVRIAGQLESNEIITGVITSPLGGEIHIVGNATAEGDLTVKGNSVVAGSFDVAGTLNGLTANAGTIHSGVWEGTAIAPNYGGTGISSYARGDLIYAGGSDVLNRVPIGKSGQVLKVVNGTPQWSTLSVSGSNITAISAGSGLTGGGSSGTVALSLDTTAVNTWTGVQKFAADLQVTGGDILLGSGTFDNPSSVEDLYVTGNLEVDGNIYGSISGSLNPGFQTGSVAFQGPTGLAEDSSNFFWDDTNNRLGIGTNSPIANINVVKTFTETSGALRSSYFEPTANAPSDSSASYRGVNGQVRLQGSANYTGTAYGLLFFVSHQGTGTASNLYGASAVTEVTGGGTASNAFGGIFSVTTALTAGTIGTAIAGDFRISLGAAGSALTNGYGIRVQPPTVTSSTITTMYGARILNQGASGITSSYGLYVDSQSGATNSYAAIFAGGNLGIGDTTPASLLTVGNGDLFQINSFGNLVKINNVAYSWPSTQGGTSTVLTNDSAGNLSWAAGGGGAPTGASYLALGLDGTLSAERVLTAGTNISFNDAGANGNLTINTVANPTFATSVTTPLLTTASGDLTLNPTGNSIIVGSTSDSTAAALNVQNSLTSSILFARNDGNVGIGTSTPQSKLDVEGGAAIGATYSGTTAAPSNGLIVEGLVGIGTNAPDATSALHINKASNDVFAKLSGSTASIIWGVWNNPGSDPAYTAGNHGFIGALTNHPFAIRTNNAERFSITAAGLIGAGTVTPDFKLDVSGDIRVEGANKLYFGGTGAADNDVNLYRSAANVLKTDDSLEVVANFTLAGQLITTPSATQILAAANAILANAAKVKVAGSGGAVILTSAPTIADGTNGQLLYIQGTDDTNTVTLQDQTTLPSSNLELGAAARLLGKGDILTLSFDSVDSVWYEVNFTNN